MAGALLLLLACAALGRALASLASECVHSVLVLDEVLDRALLPSPLLDMMDGAFPALPYVLSSATAVAVAATANDDRPAPAETPLLSAESALSYGAGLVAWTSAATDRLTESALVAFFDVYNQWLQWSVLSLSLGWEDVVVGVLTWSAVLSWARRVGDGSPAGQGVRALLPWLQSPITLLSDLQNLVHALFPSLWSLVHGVLLLLPTCIYLLRRGLHAVGAVDLDSPQMVVNFRTGENVGLHICMVLAAATCVAAAFGAAHFVCRHHHEWRVRNSFVG